MHYAVCGLDFIEYPECILVTESFKGVTVDPPMGFWPNFGGPANFFEPLSENFKIYISKSIIGFLINQLADLSLF